MFAVARTCDSHSVSQLVAKRSDRDSLRLITVTWVLWLTPGAIVQQRWVHNANHTSLADIERHGETDVSIDRVSQAALRAASPFLK